MIRALTRLAVRWRRLRGKCSSRCSYCAHYEDCPTHGWEWGPGAK